MSHRFVAGVIAAFALSTVAAGSVGAGQANGQSFAPIHVDCGSAGTYEVIGHGNGPFAAAQVIGSNQTLVPLAFEDAKFTYTDPGGAVHGPFSDPPITKGSGKQKGVWCTYMFDIDTGNGSENLSGSGKVLAKFTPGT